MPRAIVFDQPAMIRKLRSERELAALAPHCAYQWSQLAWPLPTHIAALPPEFSTNRTASLAKAIAKLLQRPHIRPLRIRYRTFFTRRLRSVKHNCLGSLLLIDAGSSPEWQRHAATQLMHAGIHEVYLLSLVDSYMESKKLV